MCSASFSPSWPSSSWPPTNTATGEISTITMNTGQPPQGNFSFFLRRTSLSDLRQFLVFFFSDGFYIKVHSGSVDSVDVVRGSAILARNSQAENQQRDAAMAESGGS